MSGNPLQEDRRPEALQVLLDASAMLLASASEDAVLCGILDLAGKTLAADAYAVWRECDDHGTWRAVAKRGLSDSYRTEIKSVPTTRLTSIQIFEDLEVEDPFHAHGESYRAEGIRSLLV